MFSGAVSAVHFFIAYSLHTAALRYAVTLARLPPDGNMKLNILRDEDPGAAHERPGSRPSGSFGWSRYR